MRPCGAVKFWTPFLLFFAICVYSAAVYKVVSDLKRVPKSVYVPHAVCASHVPSPAHALVRSLRRAVAM
jgi:hypothetical protein